MLYNLLILIILPFATLRLLWKSRQNPAYRARINERFALHLPKALQNSLLIHTVSVGEFLALRPLILHILHHHPQLNFYLTCTTPTGSAQIQSLQAQYPERVVHSYLPYDAPFITKRFVQHVQPIGMVLMETEIWRNLILAAAQNGVPVLLENARLSPKSARRYAKFARPMMQAILPLIHINAQHRFDAKRFVFLGANPENISITPNLKYHITPPPVLKNPAPQIPQSAWLWLAASTHDPEEALILQAHRLIQTQHPKALLYLAPRHPDRRAELVTLVEKHGYRPILRSQTQSALSLSENDVYIIDTLGELAAFYAKSPVAFIGGSLFGRGGHNPLEAIHQGASVCFGKDTHNFSTICGELANKRFVRVINTATPEAVRDAILDLSTYPAAQDKALYIQNHQQILERHHHYFINIFCLKN